MTFFLDLFPPNFVCSVSLCVQFCLLLYLHIYCLFVKILCGYWVAMSFVSGIYGMIQNLVVFKLHYGLYSLVLKCLSNIRCTMYPGETRPSKIRTHLIATCQSWATGDIQDCSSNVCST